MYQQTKVWATYCTKEVEFVLDKIYELHAANYYLLRNYIISTEGIQKSEKHLILGAP